jgi:hypothetical protein
MENHQFLKEEEEFIGLITSNYFIAQNYILFDKLNDFENMISYIDFAICSGSNEALFYLGHYYDEHKDISKMLEYYKRAAELNDIDAIFNLGIHYSELNNFEESVRWFEKGIQLQDPDCMCKMAQYYNMLNDDDNVKKYYLLAISLNSIKAFHLLGLWYSCNNEYDNMAYYYIKGINIYKEGKHWQKKNSENYVYHEYSHKIEEEYNLNTVRKMMEQTASYYDDEMHDLINAAKYYKMAVEKKSISGMYNLGRINYELNNVTEMKKYFLMGIENNDIDCMFELSIYYQDINDMENMSKYYIMALDEKNSIRHYKGNFINDGERDFNMFKVKKILESIPTPSESVTKKLINLRSKREIIIFENKKNLFTQLNHVVECGICYDIRLNINLNCGHCCCIDCYPQLFDKACPFCRL